MYAAFWGKIEVVRELLKRGATKELKNAYGETAYDVTGEGNSSNKEEIKALLR